MPDRWPRRLRIAVVSADADLVRRTRAALVGPSTPAVVVHEASTLRACHHLDAGAVDAFVVDARVEDACKPYEWRMRPMYCLSAPRLWVRLDGAPGPNRPADWSAAGEADGRGDGGTDKSADRDRRAAARTPSPSDRYVADTALAWDAGLWAVPLRTYARDPDFDARLRSRLALLPADHRSERMVVAVTTSEAGERPQHLMGDPIWYRAWPEPPTTALQRGTSMAVALLRLVLRPEWYAHGVGHALTAPVTEKTASAVTPTADGPPGRGGDGVTSGGGGGGGGGSADSVAQRSGRRALYRAFRNARLVTPYEAALAALVVRASALAAAFGLGTDQTGRLLGFRGTDRGKPEEGRPARSTWHKALTRVTGVPLAELWQAVWGDIDEAARLALVWPAAFRGTPPVGPSYLLRPWTEAPDWPTDADRWRDAVEVDLQRPFTPDLAPGAGLTVPDGTTGPVLAARQSWKLDESLYLHRRASAFREAREAAV